MPLNAFAGMQFASVTPPGAILDDTSPTTVAVDTAGCDWVHFVVYIGATDIAMAAFSVSESDTLTDANTLSSGSAVTDANFTSGLPSANSDNTCWIISIPITGSRKRYLDVTLTAGNGSLGSYITCLAFKQPKILTDTKAARNLGGLVTIAG